MEAIYSFDLKVFEWLSEHLWCKFLDVVMSVISITGESGIIWIVFAVVLLCFKKTRKTGIMMGAALIVMLILNDVILKELIDRPRPFNYEGWPDFVYPGIAFKIPDSPSFPSGHTASSIACATVLMIRDKRLGIPATVYALLMGLSRIYLFDHYCTDVLGGIFFGIIYGLIGYFIVAFIYNKIEKRKQEKATLVESPQS